jgi:hypothetical protein
VCVCVCVCVSLYHWDRYILSPYGVGLFFFFALLGFEFRASYLQSWHSTTWATPPYTFNPGVVLHLVYSFESQKGSFLFWYFGRTGVWTQGCEFAEQALYLLGHTSSLFCSFFGDRDSWYICLGWPGTSQQLGSQAWATHQQPAQKGSFKHL